MKNKFEIFKCIQNKMDEESRRQAEHARIYEEKKREEKKEMDKLIGEIKGYFLGMPDGVFTVNIRSEFDRRFDDDNSCSINLMRIAVGKPRIDIDGTYMLFLSERDHPNHLSPIDEWPLYSVKYVYDHLDDIVETLGKDYGCDVKDNA